MKRPMLDPQFSFDASQAPPPRRSRFAIVGWLFKLLGRIITFSPFGQRATFRAEDGTKLSRFVRALMYRLAFVPVLLCLFLVAVVFAATHPGPPNPGTDPMAYGVYYDPVKFLSHDGARLEGWLVPVIDARRVLEEKDNILGKRYPAVVLLPDFAGSREQMLPLIPSLHRAGMIVLAMNLRGAESLSSEAHTFGIKEARDVQAAVEMLRGRPYVDPNRIALVGVGTGANAALLAARNDPSIHVMVLSSPIDGFDNAFTRRVGSNHRWLPPLHNLFRWTFQVMYGVDTSDLSLSNFAGELQSHDVYVNTRPAGLLDPHGVRATKDFLTNRLHNQMAAAE